MIKSAVVTNSTPCIDTGKRVEGKDIAGEKLSKEASVNIPDLSKILNKNNNELEYPESIYRKEI